MADKKTNYKPARQFAPNVPSKPARKSKRDDFAVLVESSSFIAMLSVLIGATGLLCYMGFHNRLSMYMLDIGVILFLYSLTVKILDICIKLVKGG